MKQLLQVHGQVLEIKECRQSQNAAQPANQHARRQHLLLATLAAAAPE